LNIDSSIIFILAYYSFIILLFGRGEQPWGEGWYYRLNSLVRVATSFHGTIPLLITLGQLMFDARSSFIFMPSLDLFDKAKDGDSRRYNHWGEVDLVCIKDGKFILGEVKQSVGLFKDLRQELPVLSVLGHTGMN
jgi:hypothetical protein